MILRSWRGGGFWLEIEGELLETTCSTNYYSMNYCSTTLIGLSHSDKRNDIELVTGQKLLRNTMSNILLAKVQNLARFAFGSEKSDWIVEKMVEVGSGEALLSRGEFRNFMSVKGTKELNRAGENWMEDTCVCSDGLTRRAIELDRNWWRLGVVRFWRERGNFGIL